jgi:hypothetical protein
MNKEIVCVFAYEFDPDYILATNVLPIDLLPKVGEIISIWHPDEQFWYLIDVKKIVKNISSSDYFIKFFV